ncbi:OmpW/AlkL family protein [Roseovarius salinarum]|uniref:OmpW/AlkL family protein n=1 Tax=Roseovarius salinarum TaxID=1981892 RepID=UPI000C33E614|nr:OmpW family outer membrane protein [Roseovarius salinarum]
MKKTASAALAALLATTAAGPALAQSKGDMTIGIGFHQVAPKSNNGVAAGLPLDVDDNAQPTFTFEYFVADNVGIEVLAATPFDHDIALGPLGTIGSTKHLPPTVSLQYHFPTGGGVSPFVGAGINYTHFFDDTSVLGPLDLDDSWGMALHAGIDIPVGPKGAIRADVRWMNIESDVKLGGVTIGKAEIDPTVFGLAYVHQF